MRCCAQNVDEVIDRLREESDQTETVHFPLWVTRMPCRSRCGEIRCRHRTVHDAPDTATLILAGVDACYFPEECPGCRVHKSNSNLADQRSDSGEQDDARGSEDLAVDAVRQCPVHQMIERYPIGGAASPVFRVLGRVLSKLSRSNAVAPHRRPPLLATTPWFGPYDTARRQPFDVLCQGARHCGPIFRFELFGKTTNVVSGPEAPKVTKRAEELGLVRKSVFEPFVQVTGVPIFSAEGIEHEQLRRLVRFGFTRGTVAPFVDRISQTVREAIRDWPSATTLQPRMADLAIRAMAATLTPEPLPIEWKKLGEVGELGMMVSVRQRPRFVLRFPRMKRSKRESEALLAPIIKRHRDGLTQDDPLPWMIDAFIAARADEQQLDDDGVLGGIIYALIAAYIYLGRQSLFMLVEAARDPQTMTALRKEVDTAFAQGPLRAETLRKMPTLQALFVETTRRYPMVPGMPYETTREVEIGGYTIGPEELILLTGVPGQFDGQFYSCPWSFDQRRVRPPRNEHRAKGAYSPWGFPPRSCLAVGLSEIFSTTMVATLVHALEFELPSMSQSIPLIVAPLIGPADGQPVRLRTRDDSDRSIDPSVLFEENIRVDRFDHDVELPELVAKEFELGETIFNQGDPADAFYIILEGQVEVLERDEKGQEKRVNALGPGQAFGEIGILKRIPRTATVRALDETHLLALEREAFLNLAADLDEDADHLARIIKRSFVSRSLQRCLEGLRSEDLPTIDDVDFDRFESDTWIFREGDAADSAFIVVTGRVDVVSNVDGRNVHLTTLGPGDIFGEIGVLESCPRTASVKTKGVTVVARVDRETLVGWQKQSVKAKAGLGLLVASRLMRSLEQHRK